MIAKSKLSSTKTLKSEGLIDLEISHEEFKTSTTETEKQEKMKEDFRMMKSSNKLTKEEGKKLRQQNYDLK